MLTDNDLEQITQMQLERQREMLSVPDEGIRINYLGKEFIVYRNVFWPFEDSMPLVKNYRINPGDDVLDICTGSGVIAVFSAYKGARKVVACDINAEAVRTAKANAQLHNLSDIIEVRVSDMFAAIGDDDTFNVITGNLPFRNRYATNCVEASQWDTDLSVHRKFFAGVDRHLREGGRIYLSQANYGAVDEMIKMAYSAGFKDERIGKSAMPYPDPRVFYAFELTRM